MGKHGPCHHCGVTSTPLWRNGPPEKPVLCNACGSRWRTKGTLTNYTPLHSRLDNVDQVPCKIPRVKFVSPRTECLNQHKRKWYNDAEEETENSLSNQNSQGIMDEDTSNRSSSGSAISYSEGCMQFMGNDANEVMGSTQSNVWDMLVPSRKRTCINRPKQSSVEKLTKDLYSILREQQSKNSQTSSEDDLLFESGSPLDSIEIGHGGVLIKHLNSVSPDELEEISLSTDNSKVITNNNMHMASILPLNIKPQIADMLSMDPNSKVIVHWPEESVKSDTPPYEKFFVLRSRKSPLASLDLKDIINFEEFGKHLTWQEKQELMKYLPIVDTSQVPESLESMFKAPQFEETLLVFQRLLHDGMFDLSFGEINPEECRMLKKLVLYNLTKSEWVGYYRLLKDQKYKEKTGEERVKVEPDMVCHFSEYNKELCVNDPDDNLSEPRCTIETHQRLLSHEASEKKLGSSRSLQSFKRKNLVVQGGLHCNFKSLFAAPDTISDLLLSSQCDDDGSDQDLLVDVPSYASFPQAELLDCDILKQKTRRRSENQISDFDLSLITNRHK